MDVQYFFRILNSISDFEASNMSSNGPSTLFNDGCGRESHPNSISGTATSIELPPDAVFQNLRNGERFAVDIGGSLAKVVYISDSSCSNQSKNGQNDSINDNNITTNNGNQNVEDEKRQRSRLHFDYLQTKDIDSFVNSIQENILQRGNADDHNILRATGGGSYKHSKLICSKLGMKIDQVDEFACLVKGFKFLFENVPNEAYTFELEDDKMTPKFNFLNSSSADIYPSALVVIGSGIAIFQVEADGESKLIGASTSGGATFFGLGLLLTDAKDFEELISLATKGNPDNVDLLVKDIYGGDYPRFKASGDHLVGSFGKLISQVKDGFDKKNYNQSDIAMSLLRMICCQISEVVASCSVKHGLKKVFFCGNFVKGNPCIMQIITKTMQLFVSLFKGSVEVFFLKHGGHLGATGAFLIGAEKTAMAVNNNVESLSKNDGNVSDSSSSNGAQGYDINKSEY